MPGNRRSLACVDWPASWQVPAILVVVRRVAEPALVQEAISLADRLDRVVDPPARARRVHAVAVVAGAAFAEDLRDRHVRSAGAELHRARVVGRHAARVDAARAPARHAAQIDGAAGAGGPVIGAQVRAHHRRFAMAQRAHRAAHAVEGETVAHRAILLHVHRLETHAARVFLMAIGARQARRRNRISRTSAGPSAPPRPSWTDAAYAGISGRCCELGSSSSETRR